MHHFFCIDITVKWLSQLKDGGSIKNMCQLGGVDFKVLEDI